MRQATAQTDSKKRPMPAPEPRLRPERDAFYDPSPALWTAVDLCAVFGMPLLVTGDPGVGKTALAYHIAGVWNLNLFRFTARSDSVGQDLLYRYETLRHFETASVSARLIETGGTDPLKEEARKRYESLVAPRNFIRFEALGKAILLACGNGELIDGNVDDSELALPKKGVRARSVTIIDEIDKAPRDFPNDLLRVMDEMWFDVPEWGPDKRFQSADKMHPIVIVTSNGERELPDAFLRRCGYFHIEFPDVERLTTIIQKRLSGPELDDKTVAFARDERRARATAELFVAIRQLNLVKIPSIAELLQWARALARDATITTPLLANATEILKNGRGAVGAGTTRLNMEPLYPGCALLTKTREDRNLLLERLAIPIERTAARTV